MTAPNLYTAQQATADYAGRDVLLAAGWAEVGANTVIGTEPNTQAWPGGGARHYTLECNSNGGSAVTDGPFVKVTPGQQLSIGSTWRWDSPNTPRNSRQDIRYYDANKNVISTSTGVGALAPNNGTLAQNKRENLTPPAGTEHVRQRWVIPNAVVGDKIAFGGIQIEHGTPLSTQVVPPDPSPTTPATTSQRYGYFNGAWVPMATLLDWLLPATGVDALRQSLYDPVNDLDEQVQNGDYSAFTPVTTFAALVAACEAGQPVMIDGINILQTSKVPWKSGCGILFRNGGQLIKTYNGTGLETVGIRSGNGSYYNNIDPSHDTYIGVVGNTGGYSQQSLLGGNMLSIAGDRNAIHGLRSSLWGGPSAGRYLVMVGDDCRVRKGRWDAGAGFSGGSGVGGLRFMGGKRFGCVDTWIRSGDDVLQCVPAGNLSDPYFDIPIKGVTYLGNSGYSYSGRFMVCGLQDQYDDYLVNDIIRMHSSIGGPLEADRIRFIENDGFSGGSAFALQNKSSDGVIENIWVERCKIDGSSPDTDSSKGQPGATFFNGLAGYVQDVHMIDTQVLNHRRPGIRWRTPSTTRPQLARRINVVRGQYERGTGAPTEEILDIPAGVSEFMMDGSVLNRRGSTSREVRDAGIQTSLRYSLIN